MKEALRFIKFGLISISAGIIQIVSFTILSEVIKIPYYWVSYITALVLSVIWNFTINKKYTFRSSANIKIAMLKTLLFYAVFTPLSTIFGEYLANTETGLGWNGILVTLINMVLNFVLEFLYQRYYVYGKKVDNADKKDTTE